jgi:hypothetical protein
VSYDEELAEFRQILDEMTVVGHMSRAQELAELERLARRYPVEAKAMITRFDETEARLRGPT